MKIDIQRRDWKAKGTSPLLRLVAETEDEQKSLQELDRELNRHFSRKYHLEPAGSGGCSDGVYSLEYRVKPNEHFHANYGERLWP